MTERRDRLVSSHLRRGFFLLLCIVGVFLCGLMGVRYYRSWAQRDTIEALRRRGAYVGTFCEYFTPELADCVDLRVYDTGVTWTDEDMKLVAQLDSLTNLLMPRAEVSDDGVRHLGTLVELVYVDLSDTLVGDDGMRVLANLTSLEAIHLDRTRVTDEGIQELARLPQLTWLTLDGTRVTEEGVRRFKRCAVNPRIKVRLGRN